MRRELSDIGEQPAATQGARTNAELQCTAFAATTKVCSDILDMIEAYNTACARCNAAVEARNEVVVRFARATGNYKVAIAKLILNIQYGYAIATAGLLDDVKARYDRYYIVSCCCCCKSFKC